MKLHHLLATMTLTALAVTGTPRSARAFCGFYVGGAETSLYNDATMVVMMRDGTRTVLSMQNSYQGPPERFAMVVPVPMVLQRENVQTLPNEVFARVDRLAAPRLVEYWEADPCQVQVMERRIRRRPSSRARSAAPRPTGGSGRLGVRVEAQFEVGEYDIVVLSAEDSGGLDTWLRQEGYHIPAGAESALRPYVEAGTKFFVARVDPSRVTFQGGRAMLSPLRVHYDSDTFSLPVRLGLINSNGTQDLIVHILARNQRYEVANYPNAFIPTNVAVRNRVRRGFGTFYAALFDKTLQVNPGSVVTEYAWQAGSCDPCPGPTLTPSDIATLGGDVVGARAVRRGPPGRGGFRGGSANQFTLTRLHYRYGRGGLDEDLVFRAASPVVGGRGMPNARGRMERTVTSASTNNFQGRYAILHRWRGPVTCEHPVRGRWGGPPNGTAPAPEAATDLATQRRGVRLERYLLQQIPELRRTRGGGGARGTEPLPAPLARSEYKLDFAGPEDAPASTTPAASTTAAAALAGCAIGGRSGEGLAVVFVVAALTFLARRRR